MSQKAFYKTLVSLPVNMVSPSHMASCRLSHSAGGFAGGFASRVPDGQRLQVSVSQEGDGK